MRSTRIVLLVGALSVVLCLSQAFASVINVPGDQATIQAGIDASSNGDTVLIAPGTYFETINTNGRLIRLAGTGDPSLTVIDGNGIGRVIAVNSGEDSNLTIVGLTITGGFAANGGGLGCWDSSPRFINCIFSFNISSLAGAGAFIRNSSPVFESTEFNDNSTIPPGNSTNGGGMFIDGNSDVVFHHCAFNRNETKAYGGAIALVAPASVTAEYTLFAENIAWASGGGISVGGGGTPTVDLLNCTFVRNQATNSNCGGSAVSTGEGTITMTNSIVAYNRGCTAIRIAGPAVFVGTYICHYGNINSRSECETCVIGPGSFSAPPMFADTTARDYSLLSTSPCVDAGNPDSVFNDPDGSRNDIGAFPAGCILDSAILDCDEDGVANGDDNCPSSANPAQVDLDGDSVGDECDNCPGVSNSNQTDSDGDGIGDACDNCVNVSNIFQADSDGDSVGNACDNCPDVSNGAQVDSDGDGVGDSCDVCPTDPINDPDGDGLCGAIDNCPQDSNPNQLDSDGDGVGDVCDNCPYLSNSDQTDGDLDGIGNPCDNCLSVSNPQQVDTDGDLIGAQCDNCPAESNPDQEDADGDGVGDSCDVCPTDPINDPDGDGLCGAIDNCPQDSNPNQLDSDGDGVGDVCDNCPYLSNSDQSDADIDGVGNPCDNCLSVSNPQQVDADGDLIGDVCDNCPTTPNPDQADVDWNGIGDVCDPCFPGSCLDVNAIVVESKTVFAGETGVTVGVYLENMVSISGLVMPLEIRTVSGGAYMADNSMSLAATGRMDASGVGDFVTQNYWSAPVSNSPPALCSGPVSHTWAGASGGARSNDGSPDATFWGGVLVGNAECLSPGIDPPGSPSFLFTFDVNTSPGTFIIDTACVAPAGHLLYVDCLTSAGIVPGFTQGVITVSDCDCTCHGDRLCDGVYNVLDVIMIVNVAMRSWPDIPLQGCPVVATDLDCDGDTDVIDVVRMVNVAFRSGDPAVQICDPCAP